MVKVMLLLLQSITQKKKKYIYIYIYIEKIVKFIVFVDCSILGDVFLFENITNSQLNVNSFMI